MRRMYQTEWQNIQFSDFTEVSENHLAGAAFYRAFYDEFFKRHQNWGQLSQEWLDRKAGCANFILSRCRKGASVLAVGCGLGVIEHSLQARNPQLDLFIHEVAPTAWRWIGPEFTDERKFVGLIPECFPEGIKFDLVYLCAVDYALDDSALINLLTDLLQFLNKAGGQCLIISATFQDSRCTLAQALPSMFRWLKSSVAAALDVVGLRTRNRGQLWGWSRTQEEYRALMRRAGYGEIEDGFIDPDTRTDYWIAGR